MTKPPTFIHIVAESRLGIDEVAVCDTRAVATYYLAQMAACLDLPLVTVLDDWVYQIGDVNYVFGEGRILTIREVNKLRRAHEP